MNAADEVALEEQVRRAQGGDRTALEAVMAAVQGDVHGLALRFLGRPHDAEDAAQQILVRVLTHLGGFAGRSSFRTWVYRVASNFLLSAAKARARERTMSFEEFGEDLATGLSEAVPAAGVEEALLLEEVKIGCTLALLQCLTPELRLAYVLGEVLELDHQEGAAALAVSPATFRQRLSRARRQVTDYLDGHCGLTNEANACRCRRRVAAAVELGRVDPGRLVFAVNAARARRFPSVLVEIRRLEKARRAAALYRSHPQPEMRESFGSQVLALLGADPPS